jgi:IS5 family transposase
MAKQTTKDSGDDEWFRAIHEKDTTRDVSGRNGTGCPVARVVRAGRATLPQAGERAPAGGVERMLRIYFLQQWFNLSDAAVEEALYDSALMRQFAGIDL